MSLLEHELWIHVGPLARVHCQNLKIPVDARWIVLPKTQLGPFAAMGIGGTDDQKEKACMLAVTSCVIDRYAVQNKGLPPW